MQHSQHGEHNREENHYLRLAVMIVLSFISMYVLMYAMVNTLGDVYNSLNQVYMAGLMTVPMVVIEMPPRTNCVRPLILSDHLWRSSRRSVSISAESAAGCCRRLG